MKLIVGLGNPGSEYVGTRHNAGFMAVDRVAERCALAGPPRSRFHAAVLEGPVGGERSLVMKPLGYMNRSGSSVAEAISFYKLDPSADLLVIVDDVALPCGSIRLRPGGGPGGHNGLKDVESRLGTAQYPRLRIGIGPKPAYFDDQADYVLGRFTDEQLASVRPAINRAAEAAEVFASSGIDAAMNQFNRPDDEKGSDGNGAGSGEPSLHPSWTGG